MSRLQLLGPLGLWDDDGHEIRSVLQQPKRLAMLVYLALAPGTGYCRRDTLTGLFWPELDQDHARNALRQALHFLRSALGPGVILSRGDDELGIAPARLQCDVTLFRVALREGRAADAVDLYHNDLLPGFFVAEAGEFERWLELERSALRQAAAAAAWRLAEEAGGDAATHWARRAAGLTPDDEPAAQRLLRFLVERGDRAGAILAYEQFRRRLRSEFGLSPAAETLQLVRQIRATPGVEPPPPVMTRKPPTETSQPSAVPYSRPRHPSTVLLGLVGLGLLGAVAVVGYLRTKRAGTGRDERLLAVSPFEVTDPRYELWREGLMTVLAANLDGAGPLRTVPTAVVLRRWEGGFDSDAAARLGRATGAGVAVTGRVDAAGGDSVRIVAIVVDAGRRGSPSQLEVRGVAARFDRLADSLTVALLRELGRTRPIGAVRYASIGSRSLPALKAFLRGEQLYRRTRWDSALASYRQAVELDSAFAPAWRRIGNVLSWQSVVGGDEARAAHARAGRFNHGLSLRDSLLVLADSLSAALYGFDADPEWWQHARRHTGTLAEARRRYPEDPEIWNAIGEAGFHFGSATGTALPEILTAFERAIELDSSFTPAYLHPVYLAMSLGDSARALAHARAYLRRVPGDVTAGGIALFERILRAGGFPVSDSLYLARYQPGEIFQAWSGFGTYPDSAESAVGLVRWLAGRRWAGPMPFANPEFNRTLLARTLALRGHVGEAYRLAGTEDPGFYAELALLGAVPEPDARRQFARWLVTGDGTAARGALPWWAERGDTASINAFVATRSRALSREAGQALGSATSARARYDVAAGRAWLALALADTAAAVRLFLAIPDSLCPRCEVHLLTRAELLLRTGRPTEARRLLARELTAITDGPRPLEVRWRLARAEAAERVSETRAAAAGFGNVLRLWRNADPVLQPLLRRARLGMARTGRPSEGN